MGTYQDFIRNRGTSIPRSLPTTNTNDFGEIIVCSLILNIFIVCGKTDMRKSIDGLASIIQYEYNLDLYDDAIFLFCGGKADRFKALYWDGDGFILLYKRFNDGKLRWPRKSEEIM